MASPGRDFDPNRKYKVVLSERLKKEDKSTDKYTNSIIHLDPSLKTPSSVRTAQIKTAPDDADDVSLHLSGHRSEDAYIYGGEHGSTRTLALLFDQSSQTFTLDSIDTEYTFAHEEAAPSSPSASGDEAAGAADVHVGGEARGGVGGRGDARADPPEASDADPDNPYDWRNHLRHRSKSSSPNLESFDPSHLDALGVTGASHSSHSGDHRGHSGDQHSHSNRRQGLSPSPEPPSRQPPKKTFSPAPTPGKPLRSKPKPHRDPPKQNQTHRRASTPPSETGGGVSVEPSPERVHERDAPTPARPSINRQSDAEDSDSDGGGLEIVEDGANQRRRGRFGHRRQFLANAGEGPISLRSAANSRSPAMGMTERARDKSSDEDVEAMRLGSPMGASNHEEKMEIDDQRADDQDEEMDDADGLEEEFARALEEGGAEDDEEGGVATTGPVSGYVEDSSSESEEE